MIPWGRITGLAVAAFALVAPGARAAGPPYGRAELAGCDKTVHEAVFTARIASYRRAARMQLRFTLQALTPDDETWRRIDAAGFGEWITAPPGLGRYVYDKTVQELLAPASYRAVIQFRWRGPGGRLLHAERAISPVCRQPDARPDLVVRSVRVEADGRYAALVLNRGHEAAGPFSLELRLDAALLATTVAPALQPAQTTTVVLGGPPCASGQQIEAVADPSAEVDEADEDNNSASTLC